ncbi:hypothetical protein J2X63_003205 [Agromyces sp. 3263]|uniref:hypothetical protein n=1 Tax=Agromyces sp. 3263 TaxID=2817750 RepID=UPI00285F605F|nr:hypothetical protein [Agromyces sp. 3263]MDR6907497.1 hypothetical protein [Agromyces sp. 3263]
MRIRSIKPEFYRSEDIAALDWETRLVFIGLWSYVDDNGVGRDVEKLITADLFALEGDPTEVLRRVSRSLKVLSKGGQIVRYRVDGRPFLFVANWDKHQLVKNPNKARYPRPDAEVGSVTEHVPELYGDSTESVGTGTGEQGNSSSLVQPAAEPKSVYPKAFEEWWVLYPRKESKGAALRAWEKARKLVDQGTLAKATQAYTLMCLGKEKQFVKLPAGWLNDRKWEDDYSSARSGPPAAPALGAEGVMCDVHLGYPLPCHRCAERPF